MNANETIRIPTGKCPLCFTENPYDVSLCTECRLPLPWAKVDDFEPEPVGHCIKCNAENHYTTRRCHVCHTLLPWANALDAFQITALAPAKPAPVARVTESTLVAVDSRNQFLEAVSFAFPVLGFIAYVSLIGKLPRQALSAARSGLYGLCVWTPLLLAAAAKFFGFV